MLFPWVSYHNILFCEKVNMVFIFGWNFFKTVFLDWSLFDKHEVSNTLSYVQSSSNLHGTRPWSNFYRGVTWSGQYLVSWHQLQILCLFQFLAALWSTCTVLHSKTWLLGSYSNKNNLNIQLNNLKHKSVVMTQTLQQIHNKI